MKLFNLPDDATYTFADYFRLNPYIGDLSNFFGYEFQRLDYPLPASNAPLPRLEDLIYRLEQNMQYIAMNNETARREFLIAPVISEVIMLTHSRVRVEYPLNVNEKLKGVLDYWLQGQGGCLVVEAKNGDLEQGFVQLTAELIALDHWIDDPVPILYGAVSVGYVWQFGILKRQSKQVIQDFKLFRVPADTKDLMQVLIGILQDEESA